MQAEGTGSNSPHLPDLVECHMVLAKPDVSVSTAEAYALRTNTCIRHPDLDGIAWRHLRRRSGGGGRGAAANAFEAVLRLEEELEKIQRRSCASWRARPCMSGSGPTVFGFLPGAGEAEDCTTRLSSNIG